MASEPISPPSSRRQERPFQSKAEGESRARRLPLPGSPSQIALYAFVLKQRANVAKKGLPELAGLTPNRYDTVHTWRSRMSGNHNDIETRLWDAADELRANSKLKSSEYSPPVLGLIFQIGRASCRE